MGQKNPFLVQTERKSRHFKLRGFTPYGINKKEGITTANFQRHAPIYNPKFNLKLHGILLPLEVRDCSSK